LQKKLKNIKYIIIDECSMIGKNMLFRMHTRLQEIYANDLPFGGINILLFGHFGQLPPVRDHVIWAEPADLTQNRGEAFNLYLLFNKVICLEKVWRQKDLHFLNLLHRICEGEITLDDIETLKQRDPVLFADKSKLPQNFDEIIHLFSTKKDVRMHNIRKIKTMDKPIVKIIAQGNRSANPDKAWGLQPTLYLSVGAKVMLRINLLTTKGLVNGARGTVKDIIYAPTAGPLDLPKVVVVEFPNYEGDELIPGYPKCIPITPFTVQFQHQGKSCSRTQFPLILSWAITIHKAQGLTLDKAYVDIGHRENGIGNTYVGFSRVKTLDGLFLKSYPPTRYLKSINESQLLQNRKNEEYRLHQLMLKTLATFHK